MTYSFTTYNLFKAHIPFSRQNVGRLAKQNTILALQEWIDSLHIHEGLDIESCPTFTIPFRGVTTGTATISHSKAVSVKRYSSKSRELGCATKKSMLVTTYELDGKIITILNCHALNFVPNRIWEKTIDYWIQQIPNDGAVIFAGDINTWNISRFNYIEKKLKDIGLYYASYEHTPVLKLDHIWYRGIIPISCISDENMHSSDHYPVTLHFTIP